MARVGHAGDAEVEDLQQSVGIDHQVGRLDVPVDDAGAVCVGEAIAQFLDQLELARQRERGTLCNDLRQRLAGDVLHRDEGLAIVLADVVDGDNIWMLQPAGRPGLAREPVVELFSVGAEDLDSDRAVDRRVEGEIEHAHSAMPEQLADLVSTNCGGQRRHLGRPGSRYERDRSTLLMAANYTRRARPAFAGLETRLPRTPETPCPDCRSDERRTRQW